MADGSVRGTFELQGEQPIRTLTTIRDRGREADSAMESLGRRMDTTARKAADAWGSIDRTVGEHVTRIEGRLDQLDLKLRRLGRVNATPTVELGGFDRVNAQISELEYRLNRLSGQRASPSVGLGGGFSGGGASSVAGGGQGGARTFSSLGGIGGRLPWWAMALPVAPQLLGGAGALLGSAGSAALGAGTVGLGGAAMLGVGGGLSALAYKPAVAGLQAVAKAQQNYTKAVQEYGRASAQAATQQRALNYAITQNPAAAGAGRQLSLLRGAWHSAAAPARAQAYRGTSGSLYNLRRGVPQIAGDTALATSATSNAAISYSGFLTQSSQLSTVRTLTTAFATELPIAERSLQNFTSTFEHLSVAAIPFFHEANVWVQTWSHGLAQSSSNTAAVQAKMRGYVSSAKDWAHLTGAAFRTIRDIFSAGTPAGDSMVVQLTHTLDRWDTWINRNPAKVQSFFANAARETSTIASTIGRVAKDIWQTLQFAAPVVDRIVQALGLVSGLGPGGIGLGGAALYGAYGGLRGATGSRLPSGGALTRSFIMGGAGPGVMGRGGGGTVVGGGAYSSTLARGTGYSSYMMPRPGFQTALPGSLIGDQLPLFAAGASGYLLRGGAVAGAARGEQAFNAAYGGIKGAHFAPLEVGGSRAFGLSRALGPAGEIAKGAARFALPVLAITAAIQGAQTRGNVVDKIGGGVNAALHMGSFGILPSDSIQRLLGNNAAGAGATQAAAAASTVGARAGAVRTPGQLAAFNQLVQQGVQIRYELPPDQRAKLEAFLRSASVTAANNAGIAGSNSFETAFSTALNRGVKPKKAVATLLKGVGSEMLDLGPRGAKAFARSTATWVAQMEQDNPKLRRPLERMMGGIVDDLNRMNGTVGHTMRDLRDKVFYFNGQILSGSTTAWQAIGAALTNPAQVAQEKLLGIFGQIQAEAVDSLTSMGFSRAQATSIVTATTKGGQSRRNAGVSVGVRSAGGPATSPLSPTAPSGLARSTLGPTLGSHGRPRARGGMISGAGLLDTVRTPDGGMAAPGEAWIANRHTMNDLSSATIPKFGKTAWQMIRDEGRAHSAPPVGGPAGPSGLMASGPALAHSTVRGSSAGWVARAHPELHPGIAKAVEAVLSRFPLSITSTTGGGHASGSYHYLGEAADIAGAGGLMNSAASWIGGSGLYRSLTEGIHNPNLSVQGGRNVPPSFWGASTWAGHTNHIHMAVAGALGAFGLGGGARGGLLPSLRLRAPRSGLGGVPGALADQGSRLYAAGLSQKLNAQIGAAGGFSGAGFSGGGTSSANQALGRRMMLAAGWPASEWPSLQALWTQESGWNANITNPSSGAYGIPQALGHGHPFNLGDAPAQIAWGLNYIRGRYGSPSAAEAHERSAGWYSRGGRASWAGWHGKGTSFTTRGPTVFGAGEGGRRERVTVSPASSPTRGGGARIQVIMHHVHMGSGAPSDAQALAEDVAGRILDALDNAGVGGSDDDLMGSGS